MKANLTMNQLFESWNIVNTVFDSHCLKPDDVLIENTTGCIKKAEIWAKEIMSLPDRTVFPSLTIGDEEKIEIFNNLMRF